MLGPNVELFLMYVWFMAMRPQKSLSNAQLISHSLSLSFALKVHFQQETELELKKQTLCLNVNEITSDCKGIHPLWILNLGCSIIKLQYQQFEGDFQLQLISWLFIWKYK